MGVPLFEKWYKGRKITMDTRIHNIFQYLKHNSNRFF